MKRIAWLLLAVVCTSFVQVQPIEPVKAQACRCCHCKIPGSCGMPGCGQPTASTSRTITEPARIAAARGRRAGGLRVSQAGLAAAPFRMARARLPLPAAEFAALAAGVPLFKAHCSFLL
jgi:hypothetical protein